MQAFQMVFEKWFCVPSRTLCTLGWACCNMETKMSSGVMMRSLSVVQGKKNEKFTYARLNAGNPVAHGVHAWLGRIGLNDYR